MKRTLLFICLIVLSLFSVSAITYIGDRTSEDYCKIQIISEETFDELRPLYSLDDFINDTYQDMLSSNFSNTYIIEIPVFNQENLDIIFDIEEPNNSLLFGTYRGSFESIRVYIKTIHDYGDSLSWTEEMIQNKIKNTLLHEIAHYLDISQQIYGNDSQTAELFNIEGQRDINVTNVNYFIDLYNQTNQFPNVPVEIRDSVQYDILFTSPTAPYDEKDFFDEIVARTSALCLYSVDNQNYEFTNQDNYYYCTNNFNISNSYTQRYEQIVDRILITWFYFDFPEERSININLDGLCATQQDIPLIFQIIETLIEEITDFLTNNYLYLIVSLLILGFITSIILLIGNLVKKTLK